jgi:hypothetical protein
MSDVPFVAMLALALALSACSTTRHLESCAAYLIILGPTTVTLTCPPRGFTGSETTPEGGYVEMKYQ